jgi:hypothetical protein
MRGILRKLQPPGEVAANGLRHYDKACAFPFAGKELAALPCPRCQCSILFSGTGTGDLLLDGVNEVESKTKDMIMKTANGTKKSRTMKYAKQTTRTVANVIKPVVRKAYTVARDNPEMAVAGAAGYWLGYKVDTIPVVGRATLGNAKWVLGTVGAIYGYNRAIMRRTLCLAETGMRNAITIRSTDHD